LDPVLVASRHPIPFFILLDGTYAGMREQLEGGSNLFGGWDIVRVLHAYGDPPDILLASEKGSPPETFST
jgi:hypothetical protein